MAVTTSRPGSRAKVRYVRMSASKARLVLNQIRNKHVGEAFTLLTYSERRASEVIQKALKSAVANAQHNDEILAEELYVSAAYADEGPTLKRFRPRARGRAGRIHKQTCHITVEVARYTDEELDAQRQRAEARGAGRVSSDASAERRKRVARSRAAQGDDTPEAEAAEADVVEALESPEIDSAAEEIVVEGTTPDSEVGDGAEPEATDGEPIEADQPEDESKPKETE